MSYSSSLTDQEWEILEPLLCQVLPQKKQTRPSNWTKRDIQGRHLLPTQEWLQLAGFTQRFAALLHGLLALQAVASRRGDRETDVSFTWTGSGADQKKPKWTTLIMIDSQAVQKLAPLGWTRKAFVSTKRPMGLNGI
jgi:hypothetical protein